MNGVCLLCWTQCRALRKWPEVAMLPALQAPPSTLPSRYSCAAAITCLPTTLPLPCRSGG